MPFGDTIRVIQPGQRRLKIFIDFWNVVINAREQCSFDVSVKWNALANMLVRETQPQGFYDESAGTLAGCYIFGSFDRSNGAQFREIEAVLDEYGPLEGLFFDMTERIGKETSHKCSSCGAPVQRSSEAGVDIKLTIEMIKHTALREHDYLALVSSDRDFVPLLRYLKDGGQRVIHASPGHPHGDMRNTTWKQVSLQDSFPSLCRINNHKRIIFYEPRNEMKLKQARDILLKSGREFSEINLCDKTQISDKDLKFLMMNQSFPLSFRKSENDEQGWNVIRESRYDNLHQFRKSIADGMVEEGLPYVMHKGSMEASSNEQWGWLRGSGRDSDIWRDVQFGDASVG